MSGSVKVPFDIVTQRKGEIACTAIFHLNTAVILGNNPRGKKRKGWGRVEVRGSQLGVNVRKGKESRKKKWRPVSATDRCGKLRGVRGSKGN